MSGRLSDVAIGLGLACVGVALLYLAYHVCVIAPGPRLLEAMIPVDAEVDVRWSSAGRLPGLGEYVLDNPLLVVLGNGTSVLLGPGVTIGVATSLVKVMPFLALVGIITGYTGVSLLVKLLTGRELPFPSLKIVMAALAITMAIPALLPSWLDLGPGSRAYLEVREATRTQGLVVVTEGMLMSEGRLLADQVMRALVVLALAGISLMLIGAGLILAFTKPGQTP